MVLDLQSLKGDGVLFVLFMFVLVFDALDRSQASRVQKKGSIT